MKCFVATSLMQKSVVFGALIGAAFATGRDASAEIVGAPIDLSASVHEALLPEGTIFDDSEPAPKQSAEALHIATKGDDPTGRGLGGAFASALAESDGNGGVGVS
jgi:hypothetical protein